MKAWLMHPDRDVELKREWTRRDQDLAQDLGLEPVFAAMAGDDDFLLSVVRSTLASGIRSDLETVRYRQEVLRDCLGNPALPRALYALATEALDPRRQPFLGLGRHPGSRLHGSVDWLAMFAGMLGRLRAATDAEVERVESRGFRRLFETLRAELDDEYLARVEGHLAALRLERGVLMSADLGPRNEGTNYTLRRPSTGRSRLRRLLGGAPPGYTFRVPERDETGGRALGELRDRGIERVANAAAQAAEHIQGFFRMLRAEAAFYVGCLNLRDRLAALGLPVALPRPEPAGSRRLRFRGLYDVSLALTLGRGVVPNSLEADGKDLLIVTGANQGGKSSFLRSLGLAQLMMQCGMFVGAESLEAELCRGVFTHYKREEDPAMTRGQLDEELARLSELADAVGPDALLLLNESLAATNEREGSEIARQVVSALLERRVKIVFVTHLYLFAHGMAAAAGDRTLSLRAERRPDGTRTFKILPGEPLETSYGDDLYREIFGSAGSFATPG